MKKTALFLTIAAALLLAGCHSDIDDRITQLKQDVSELEIRVSRLNESLNSLSELVGALEKNDHITNISESGSGADKTYRITFASGSTLTFHNGSEGVSPIVGIQYDDNYKSYYWTIQMGPDSSPTWMTNSYGQRVKATGSVPQLKIEDGVWWYSFDGSGWSKCNWGPTQGEAGSSVFVTVDTSDPYFVRFVLTSWVGIKMPTQKAFDELNDQCRKLNESFKSYTDIINSINGNTFVKSVAEYKQGDDSGYRFTLESGKVISIRTGRSSRDSVLLSAKAYTDGKYYWVFRNKSSEKYQWLKYNDKMICVTMTDVTPRISIQQVSGSLYFAVSVDVHVPEQFSEHLARAASRIDIEHGTAVSLEFLIREYRVRSTGCKRFPAAVEDLDLIGTVFTADRIGLASDDQMGFVDQGDIVAEFLDRLHVVGGQDDGRAFVTEPQYLVPYHLGVDGVESGEGFVENQQLRFVKYGGDELDLLGHALGKFLDFLVPPALDPETDEPFLEFRRGGGTAHAFEAGQIDGLLPHFHFLE